MNKAYLVRIHYEAPYPKFRDYAIAASNFGLAVNRAFRQFRKDKVTTKRQTHIKFDVYCELYTGGVA